MTASKRKDFTIEPFPKARRLTQDAGWLNSRRHNVHGLMEIDATAARSAIAAHKQQTGETISFTAFIIACLARAAADTPQARSCRDWRGRLAVFDDVNINTMFDAEIDGCRTVLPRVIEAADKKSVRQISDEIREAQRLHKTTQNSLEASYIKRFVAMPTFVRRMFYWYIYRNPRLLHKRFGTIAVTAVGMFGKGGGWGIAFGNNTLSVTLGGIEKKPGVADSEIKIREYLSVTLTMDHDIIDGAPAAAFARQFRELVESAHGLNDM